MAKPLVANCPSSSANHNDEGEAHHGEDRDNRVLPVSVLDFGGENPQVVAQQRRDKLPTDSNYGF